jgi:uncharacterized protein (TIGR00297 family)
MPVLKSLFNASSADWIRFLGFLIGILGFISIAEKTRSVLGWSPEVNRKLVHILTGVLVFFTPLFFVSNRPLIWMAVLFIIINYVGIKTGKLQGMHGTDRRSYGTVFYPLTFLFLAVMAWESHKIVMMLSMLILALSDAAAAIVGENLKSPHEYRLAGDSKSYEGSAVMFAVSFLIVTALLPLIDTIDGRSIPWSTAAWIGVVTAVVATALEALSSQGSDNITAPLGAAFILSFMLQNTVDANLRLSIGLVLAFVVAFLSFRVRFLTASGSVGTFILATLIFGTGGWKWSIPILTFFLLSSLLSKLGKTRKVEFRMIFEKSNRRDIGQVIANGAVPGTILLAHHVSPHPAWYVAYLGSLAAVNADTWATELGILSKSPTRSIRNFRVVPPGTSGGITTLGTLSAFLGTWVIAFSGWMASGHIFAASFLHPIFWIIVGAGLAGSLFDSLLGTTVQAQYRCPDCQKITEKKIHCDTMKTDLISGIGWLHNDWVNAFCSLCGALLAGCGGILYRPN